MLYRKIAKRIEDYFKSDSRRVMVIEGARQTGKSYIIRHVGQKLFENYIEINMEEDRIGERIFAEATTVNDFYMALSVFAGERLKDKSSTLVFIDEIQAYDYLLSLLKFLRADDRFTYIASGSQLGIALKQTPSVPVGSLSIVRMYPMDFEEFLIANGVGELAINSMREAFSKGEQLSDSIHAKMMDFFRKYLLVGGLPAAVDSYIASLNIVKIREIQSEIHRLYGNDASRYEEESDRKLKIRRIYEMIPSNLENKKKRVIFKDIEEKKWKRAEDYKDEFEYLISSGIALAVNAISNPTFPLVESTSKNLTKLYLNDVGMLSGIYYRNNIKSVMDDQGSVNLGSVYETVVAQELQAHGFNLFYYDNKKNGEVDYLVDDYDNQSIIPIEIKSGKDYTVHSALNRLMEVEDYGIKRGYVLSNEQKVFIRNGITYMPIYYIMFFSDDSTVVGSF